MFAVLPVNVEFRISSFASEQSYSELLVAIAPPYFASFKVKDAESVRINVPELLIAAPFVVLSE